MAGQRPPRAAVRAAVRACLGDLEPGARVLVALSGGADSLALTAATVAVGAEMGFLCEAVVIDHQLQAGSGEVAARAAGQARILGCAEARVIAVEVPRGSGSGGLEAAARAVRYAALDTAAGVAAGGAMSSPAGPAESSPDRPVVGTVGGSPKSPPAAAILLGHTREDQAETVLLGLARGSGTRSLAGMATRTGRYRRPLLDLPREVVVAAASEAASEDPRLEPWTDPHNTDAAYARVRVRREVLPVLEAALGPGIVEALARTATLAREDADALDAWADQVWSQVRDRAGSRPPAEVTASEVPGHSAGAPATPSAVPAPSRADDPGRLLTLEEQEPAWIIGRSPSAGPIGNGGGSLGSAGDLSAPDAAPPADGPGPIALPIAALSVDGVPLPPAIVHRVVRRFLLEAGCPSGSLTAGHIRAVAALLDPRTSARAEVALPGDRRARREVGAVVVRV